MSTYKDLCKIYDEARKEYFDAFNECAKILGEFFNGFCKRLDVTANSGVLGLVPDKQNYQEGLDYKPQGAIHLDADGYWHSCLVLKLTPHAELNTEPAEVISFLLRLKKRNNQMTLLIGDCEEEFIFENEQFNDIYDYVDQFIKEFYSSRLNSFLEKETKTRKIGFKLG